LSDFSFHLHKSPKGLSRDFPLLTFKQNKKLTKTARNPFAIELNHYFILLLLPSNYGEKFNFPKNLDEFIWGKPSVAGI